MPQAGAMGTAERDVVNAETSDRAEYRAASCEESLQKS
jgi:hypothetical protein